PKNVEFIPEWAFKDCVNLTSVTICGNVDSLGGIFDGCTSLNTVIIEEEVRYIGSIFVGCTALDRCILNQVEGYKWQISIDEENNTWVDISTLDNDTLISYLTTEINCCLKQVEI
ncbi:MAG: leucine-rich repeat protein, partial [Clostridia bacterium]|nr:leucine-rich repeat protein [Clostridia bacterium]